MPDSVFRESMRQGIICVCVCFFSFFVWGDTSYFPQDERDGVTSFITITSEGVGKSEAMTDLGIWD